MQNPILEQITPSLTLEWLTEPRLAVLTPYNLERDTVDAFTQTIITTLNNWSLAEPIRILYSFEQIGASIYMRQRSQYAARHTPDRVGRAAVLLTTSLLHRAIAITVNRQLYEKKHLQRGLFYNRGLALAWLREDLSVGESPNAVSS